MLKVPVNYCQIFIRNYYYFIVEADSEKQKYLFDTWMPNLKGSMVCSYANQADQPSQVKIQ
jgi:hypothetical protein